MHLKFGTTTIRGACLFSLVLLLGACASTPRIITNQDPNANFFQFRTFDFVHPLGTDREGTQTLTSQHLVSAVTDELQMRGMQRTNINPDLRVNFFLSTRETISTHQVPNSGMSMHRGSSRYGTWGGYSRSRSTTRITQSTEGTLAIDLIDASNNRLVWEGAAAKRVTDNTRRNLEETLRSAVADLLAEMP
jgi:hypothetical protein